MPLMHYIASCDSDTVMEYVEASSFGQRQALIKCTSAVILIRREEVGTQWTPQSLLMNPSKFPREPEIQNDLSKLLD